MSVTRVQIHSERSRNQQTSAGAVECENGSRPSAQLRAELSRLLAEALVADYRQNPPDSAADLDPTVASPRGLNPPSEAHDEHR